MPPCQLAEGASVVLRRVRSAWRLFFVAARAALFCAFSFSRPRLALALGRGEIVGGRLGNADEQGEHLLDEAAGVLQRRVAGRAPGVALEGGPQGGVVDAVAVVADVVDARLESTHALSTATAKALPTHALRTAVVADADARLEACRRTP